MKATSQARLLWCTLWMVLAAHHVKSGNSTISINQATPLLLSAVSHRDVEVGPYGWKYFRVELPVGFSSVTIAWEKKWNTGNQTSTSDAVGPVVCFRFGGPPVPAPVVESLMMAALAAGRVQNMTDRGKCAVFEESVNLILTNQQIVSGVLHIGIFSDPKPTRTQSQMISRGDVYAFELQYQVSGCTSSVARGEHCIVDVQSLGLQFSSGSPGILSHQHFEATNLDSNQGQRPLHAGNYAENDERNTTFEKTVYLAQQADGSWSTAAYQCVDPGNWKIHALQVVDIATSLEFKLEEKSVACSHGFVRYGALPENSATSYNLDVTSPLSITAPELGWWYLGVLSANATDVKTPDESGQCCYTVSWRLRICEQGKVGEGCVWNVTTLERVLVKRVESPFDSYYKPITSTESKSSRFPMTLVPATSSTGTNSRSEVWAYFCFNVPKGAAGSVLSLDITMPASIELQLMARYEALPTSDIWDYYAKQVQTVTSINSDGRNATIVNRVRSTSLKLDLIYPAEGIWFIAVRSFQGVGTNENSSTCNIPAAKESNSEAESSQSCGQESSTSNNLRIHQEDSGNSESDMTMHVGLHGCPAKCSGHGVCETAYEESRLHMYSYCYCDRTHGDLDCSLKIVGGGGQALHIFALVASNLAAALPSLWCLRHKVYSEWIIYTTSGISSAIYHSCDAGGWCALSYSSLQFLDFWLSFLSVVATFIHMAAFLGSSKAAMHVGGAIFTAVIAKENATSAANVIIVMCIGAAGLLLGFALESCSAQSTSLLRRRWRSSRISTLPTVRWDTIILYVRTSAGLLGQRFRWPYVLIGVATLVAAKLSFFFETATTYWMWHSLWHVSIYTSAFFFLKSRISSVVKEAQVEEEDPLLHASDLFTEKRKRSPAGEEAAELASFAEDDIELSSG